MVSRRTGASTGILICTRGRSTGSPASSNTKPRWKVSQLSKCPSVIRRSRVRAVVGNERRTVLNADCMSAMSAVQWRTQTWTALRTFGRKYLRVHRISRWIGVTAGWHSHRRSCLTRKLVRLHLKNRSRRKPQYPNPAARCRGNLRRSGRRGCQVHNSYKKLSDKEKINHIIKRKVM
jgi:hypothetical protein